MSLRQLPEAKTFARPQNYQQEVPSDVLAKWAETPLAASDDDGAAISVFDVIGEDPWSGNGVTSKRIAAALRSIGTRDVTVKINSPGGDMFEGISIYNLLRAHPAKVRVEVMGWAASAASIIAMAGDEIVMGVGAFVMVHNAWGNVVGNRHDLASAADMFGQFDAALADIYEARTGLKREDIVALMDGETFMGATDAVAKGFADQVSDDLEPDAENSKNESRRAILARRRTEAALASAGYTRAQRSEMLSEITEHVAGRDASHNTAARDAGTTVDLDALARLIQTMKS